MGNRLGMAENSAGAGSFAPTLTLLAACALINYVDRGNLSIAAPVLKDELHISVSQLGILLGAFFWSYTAMQFVIGWVVDRFGANLVLAAGCSLWSLATVTTGLARGYTTILAMRLLLGIGESAAYPAISKILALHLPEHRRGFANGAVMMGLSCGTAVGALGTGLAIVRYGWRAVFIFTGLVSLAWLPAWAKWKPQGKAAARSLAAGTGPGFSAILRQRSFWGASAGQFSECYLLYFMLLWLPFYLVHDRHFSMPAMAKMAAAFYFVTAASAGVTGWLADAWIRIGSTPTVVRKSVMGLGSGVAAIAVVGAALSGPGAFVGWLMVVGVALGMLMSGIFTFAQAIAGPQAAGNWTGLQNGFGNIAGVVAPALSGFLVDRAGNFLVPFAIVAAVLVGGACSWVFLIGPVEPVDWAAERRALPPIVEGA